MPKQVSYGKNVIHNYDKVDPRGSSDSSFYQTYGPNASYHQTPKEESANRVQKGYETPLLGNKKWSADNAGTSGVLGYGYVGTQRYYGGKKTKRKRSRRTKKSRSYRKK